MTTSDVNRVMQVTEPGGDFSLSEREIGEPGIDQVRIVVEACGVCASDEAVINGILPGVSFPVVTGHEIAGRIDALGPGVSGWSVGDRVAVGWYGGSCGHCDACRQGDGVHCPEAQIPGVAYDGGYADYIIVPAVALVAVPNELSAVEAAPLACAGVTTYNALRHSAARAGDTVAVQGIGGLGHLGVQFAAKMGFDTVAIARGRDKVDLAHKLGATHFIDSAAKDVATELLALGGAKVVLATAPNSAAISATVDGLARRGEIVLVGVGPDPVHATPSQLVFGGRSIRGHASGVAVDTQDTMRFAAQTGIRPWVEEAPLEDAHEAYHRMRGGDARFRVVLTTGN